MHATLNGNHAAVARLRVAQPANHRVRPVVVAVVAAVVGMVEAVAAVKAAPAVAVAQAQVPSITAARAASSARQAAHRAPSRQPVHPARARALAELRADSLHRLAQIYATKICVYLCASVAKKRRFILRGVGLPA